MNFNKLKNTTLASLIMLALSACGTSSPNVTDPPEVQAAAIKAQGGVYKIGNPYKILGRWYYPKEDYEYTEEGIASWYGPDFHSKKTANGEDYDMHTITAAHRTLPLPSFVKVTNLDNGRSLVVRVNDRGPYARERIIDISKKGAQLLGFLEKGTTRVKVEVLEKESKNIKAAMLGESAGVNATPITRIAKNEMGKIGEAPKPAPVVLPAAPKVVDSTNGYFVQVAALSSQSSAEVYAQEVEKFGKTNIVKAVVNGKSYYRVRVGPFSHHQEAVVAQAKMRNSGISAAHVIHN